MTGGRRRCRRRPPVLGAIALLAGPLLVAATVTVTHLPDCDPTIVPLEVYENFWFAPPSQLQISTMVPSAVALPGGSRHLPITWSAPFEAASCWLAPPLQPQMSSWVRLVVLAMHLPEPAPPKELPPPPAPRLLGL